MAPRMRAGGAWGMQGTQPVSLGWQLGSCVRPPSSICMPSLSGYPMLIAGKAKQGGAGQQAADCAETNRQLAVRAALLSHPTACPAAATVGPALMERGRVELAGRACA